MANFVSIYLLGGASFDVLPTPQYNQFDYIDKPLVTSENVERLQETWQQYAEQTEQWCRDSNWLNATEDATEEEE